MCSHWEQSVESVEISEEGEVGDPEESEVGDPDA